MADLPETAVAVRAASERRAAAMTLDDIRAAFTPPIPKYGPSVDAYRALEMRAREAWVAMGSPRTGNDGWPHPVAVALHALREFNAFNWLRYNAVSRADLDVLLAVLPSAPEAVLAAVAEREVPDAD